MTVRVADEKVKDGRVDDIQEQITFLLKRRELAYNAAIAAVAGVSVRQGNVRLMACDWLAR